MLIFILHTKTVRNCSYTYQCETSPVVLAWSAWFKKKYNTFFAKFFFSLHLIHRFAICYFFFCKICYSFGNLWCLLSCLLYVLCEKKSAVKYIGNRWRYVLLQYAIARPQVY
jgi:hypothetical protein